MDVERERDSGRDKQYIVNKVIEKFIQRRKKAARNSVCIFLSEKRSIDKEEAGKQSELSRSDTDNAMSEQQLLNVSLRCRC